MKTITNLELAKEYLKDCEKLHFWSDEPKLKGACLEEATWLTILTMVMDHHVVAVFQCQGLGIAEKYKNILKDIIKKN